MFGPDPNHVPNSDVKQCLDKTAEITVLTQLLMETISVTSEDQDVREATKLVAARCKALIESTNAVKRLMDEGRTVV